MSQRHVLPWRKAIVGGVSWVNLPLEERDLYIFHV